MKTIINHFSDLFRSVADNIGFILAALAISAAIVLVAVAAEKIICSLQKKQGREAEGRTRESMKIHRMTLIAVLTALAVVLMTLEFPIPGIPDFYKLDFSEIPVIIGAFAMGPLAGVAIEFLKVVLHIFVAGTTTAYVGDFANFVMGCCYIVPASIIYMYRKKKLSAQVGMIVGMVCVVVAGCLMNAYYLLPTYAKMMNLKIDDFVGMGQEKNQFITSLKTLIVFGVIPFNLLKYGAVSLVTRFSYKHISKLLKKQP